MKVRPLQRAGAALLFAMLLWAAGCGSSEEASKAEPPRRPNIVVILTDDQPERSLDAMPKLQERVVRRGLRFENFLVNDPICCPSRVTILQGQYRHNHQLPGQIRGCALPFFERGEHRHSIGALLKEAGYRTSFIGKYLNRYEQYLEAVGPDAELGGIMLGWDDYHLSVDRAFWEFEVHSNGEVESFPREGRDPVHQTDVFSHYATRFIAQSATAHEPFFLFVSTDAPHWPAQPALRHQNKFSEEGVPRVPSFDEDTSDKTALRNKPPFDDEAIEQLDAGWRRVIQSLAGVDDLVGRLLDALDQHGLSETTYVFFLSDHGVHSGEHRVFSGKGTPYEESVSAPFVVSGPGVREGAVAKELVANVDLLPTWLSLAGARVPERADGRSLDALLHSAEAPQDWRDAFLLESPYETRNEVPRFVALRTDRYKWIEFEGGGRELFDLAKDPYELENIAGSAEHREVERQLASRLDDLIGCSGQQCRDRDRGHAH